MALSMSTKPTQSFLYRYDGPSTVCPKIGSFSREFLGYSPGNLLRMIRSHRKSEVDLCSMFDLEEKVGVILKVIF